MTPTRARELLAHHGLAARKSDGQNFLVDPNTVRRIVAGAGLAPTDHVVEVGPGLGAMTGLLADVVDHVTAIEIDAGLVEVVSETLGDRANLTVVHADAMDLDFDALAARHDGAARLVSNLPYNVATPLVLHVFAGRGIRDAWVMVQREVAARWAADVGDEAHGAVSVKLALVADVAIEMAIPRQVFWPVPNVHSVMVRISRRADALPPDERRAIAQVVDAAFRQRRKTLRNNLRRAWGRRGVVGLEAAGIDQNRRAETLATEEFVVLERAMDTVSPEEVPGT